VGVQLEDVDKAPVNAQLDLWESELVKLPWRGRNPRSLTRGSEALFLRREPEKDERFFVDPKQLEIVWRRQKKAPWAYQGAPLLVEGEDT